MLRQNNKTQPVRGDAQSDFRKKDIHGDDKRLVHADMFIQPPLSGTRGGFVPVIIYTNALTHLSQ